jgi:hypothetical protein
VFDEFLSRRRSYVLLPTSMLLLLLKLVCEVKCGLSVEATARHMGQASSNLATCILHHPYTTMVPRHGTQCRACTCARTRTRHPFTPPSNQFPLPLIYNLLPRSSPSLLPFPAPLEANKHASCESSPQARCTGSGASE